MDSYNYNNTAYGNAYPPPPTTTVHNKKIQNYVFNMNQVLGRGNFSKVYRAVNQISNQIVAVKVVELSSIKTPALVQLLYSQIDILKTLKHPNVLNCMEVFTSTNNCYIITQLCDGGDVESRLRQKGPMDQREARRLIYEVYQGLKYLAEHNIVHRDIKIANIFLKNGIAKIADFGFAKRTTQSWKDINIGSPIYMAPQGILQNIYGPKTDVWAFGVFLYEILHGDTPLGFCKTQADLKYHIVSPLPAERIKHNLPHELKDLILRCLEIDQRKRISARQIENHPYMQNISVQFARKESFPSLILHSLEQSKSRDYHTSQDSTTVTSKLMLPTSFISQNQPQQMPGVSPHKNFQKFISIPNSANRDTGKSLSPKINHSSGLNIYNNFQAEQKKSINGLYSNNDIKRGVSLEKSGQYGNTWQQQPPYNIPTNIITSGSSLKVAIPDAMVNSKQLDTQKQSPMRRASGKLIISAVSFQQCVQLLHYCRLIYKTITIMTKSLKNMNLKIVDTYSNWLLDTLDEISDRIDTYVRFQGQRGTARKMKLKEVINEYYTKYNKELKRKQGIDTNLAAVQAITIKSLFYLESQIMSDQQQDKREIIRLSHYLYFITEINKIIESCMERGNYAEVIKGCNIENFLNNKKESFDMNSYNILKPKLFRLAE